MSITAAETISYSSGDNLTELRAPGTAPPRESGSDTTPRRLRILIIEDNRDYAESLRLLFEPMGHEILVAHTGTSGLETALRELPDMVISDVALPGMDGCQVARALRRHPTLADVLLVALTGYGSPGEHGFALECGFDAYFVKPIEVADILQLVDAAAA